MRRVLASEWPLVARLFHLMPWDRERLTTAEEMVLREHLDALGEVTDVKGP